MNERQHNLRIAQSICDHFVWNGQTFHEGECVALLDGKVVAVSSNVDDAISALRALAPDPKRGMVIEVSHPEADVIR
jgi:hypothetical protein